MSSFANLDFDRIRRAIERADKHHHRRHARLSAAGRRRVRRASPRPIRRPCRAERHPRWAAHPQRSLGNAARFATRRNGPTYLAHLTADGFTPKAEPQARTGTTCPPRSSARECRSSPRTPGWRSGRASSSRRHSRRRHPAACGSWTRPCRSHSDRSGTSPASPIWPASPSTTGFRPPCGGDLHRAQYVAGPLPPRRPHHAARDVPGRNAGLDR